MAKIYVHKGCLGSYVGYLKGECLTKIPMGRLQPSLNLALIVDSRKVRALIYYKNIDEGFVMNRFKKISAASALMLSCSVGLANVPFQEEIYIQGFQGDYFTAERPKLNIIGGISEPDSSGRFVVKPGFYRNTVALQHVDTGRYISCLASRNFRCDVKSKRAGIRESFIWNSLGERSFSLTWKRNGLTVLSNYSESNNPWYSWSTSIDQGWATFNYALVGQNEETQPVEPSPVVPVPIDLPPAATPTPGAQPFFFDEFNKDLQQISSASTVFLGDSITAEFENGFGSQLWVGRLLKYNPVNLGVPGDRTENMLWRLQETPVQPQIEMVVIKAGTNNIFNFYANEDTIVGIETVIALALTKFPNAKLLVMSIPPLKAGDRNFDFTPSTQIVNQAVATSVANLERVDFIDISAQYLVNGQIDLTKYRDVAVHFNAEGYVIWADAVERWINGL